MKCPHCAEDIDEKLISKYFASKGGKISKRVLTSEQAKAMVKSRENRKQTKKNI